MMNELDREHRERMGACQTLQPCPKVHPHGPGCYGAATVYAVVVAWIAMAKAPKPIPPPAPRDTSRPRGPDLGAQITNHAFGEARHRK